jgi:hypothetical protein
MIIIHIRGGCVLSWHDATVGVGVNYKQFATVEGMAESESALSEIKKFLQVA